jgi:hypothetical protein
LRRKTLTLGILLILAAFFVLEQGLQLFAPFAEVAGLSTQYMKEDVVVPPTLYSVPSANYSYAPEALVGGRQYTGSLQVADSRQLGFYVMDEGNFSVWRTGRPASLIFANPNAISYNFTLSPPLSGTYFFVFDNQENSPLTVVFTLSSVQDVTVLNPFVAYAGYELLLLGLLFSIIGVRGGGKKKETKRAVQTTEAKPEPSWNCKFCGARNPGDKPTFCSKCGRAQN